MNKQAQEWIDKQFEDMDVDEVLSEMNSFEMYDFLLEAFKAGYKTRKKEEVK